MSGGNGLVVALNLDYAKPSDSGYYHCYGYSNDKVTLDLKTIKVEISKSAGSTVTLLVRLWPRILYLLQRPDQARKSNNTKTWEVCRWEYFALLSWTSWSVEQCRMEKIQWCKLSSTLDMQHLICTTIFKLYFFRMKLLSSKSYRPIKGQLRIDHAAVSDAGDYICYSNRQEKRFKVSVATKGMPKIPTTGI